MNRIPYLLAAFAISVAAGCSEEDPTKGSAAARAALAQPTVVNQGSAPALPAALDDKTPTARTPRAAGQAAPGPNAAPAAPGGAQPAEVADDAGDDETPPPLDVTPLGPPKGPGQPGAAPNAPPAGDRAEAGVGSGKKGHYGSSYIEALVATRFTAEERIIFETQIPHELDLYKAAHNNQGPKTHEEFWKAIIVEAGIRLPELPEGEKYVYDPKLEKLMVEQPNRTPQ